MLHSAAFLGTPCASRRGSSPFEPTILIPARSPMALPLAASDRQLKHRRSIDVQIYSRADGLWEVDAHLQDVRPGPTRLSTGVRAAGKPIHDMCLRLVVDDRLNVLEAGAATAAMPYAGECDSFGEVYGRLVGLNLMKGFRQAVKERLGGVQACTHLNELSQVLPTAVVQAMAGEVFDVSGAGEGAAQPFQIDRCRALRADGPAVQTHYPRWFRPSTHGAAPPGEVAASLPTTESPRDPS